MSSKNKNIFNSTRTNSNENNFQNPRKFNIQQNLGILLLVIILLVTSCRPNKLPATTPPPSTVTPTEGLIPKTDMSKPIAPRVIEYQPQGGKELPTDGEILVRFDQAMDQKATQSAWQLESNKGKVVNGEIKWLDSRSFQFKPANKLENGGTYLASLTTNAKAANGKSLDFPWTIKFNTIGELQVSQVFPADGSIDVEQNAVVTAVFNRPVVPLVTSEEKKNLPIPITISPEVSGQGEWVNTSVFAFHPDHPLKGNTNYIVTVKAGLQDAAQETQLASDYQWQFTTVTPSIQQIELSNGMVNPGNDIQNIPLDTTFAIRFLQPMDQPNVESHLSLVSDTNASVPFFTRWDQDGVHVEITPTIRLSLDTHYTLILDREAQDMTGGSLKEGLHWSFYTVSPPNILSVTPSDGTVQDHFSSGLSITFVSPMKIDSVKDKIIIYPKPKEISWFYNEWDWSFHAYILQPSAKYEVTFLPGMEDIYGNQITTPRKIHFTTAAYDPQAYLQMPQSPVVFRADTPMDFYASFMNVREVNFTIFQLTPTQFSGISNGTLDWKNIQNRNIVWEKQLKSTGVLNQNSINKIELKQPNGEQLPMGLYLLTLDSPDLTGSYSDNRLLILANSNLVFKNSPAEGLVWLTDLTTGKPIPNIPVNIYDKNFQKEGYGITDKDGLVKVQFQSSNSESEQRFAMTDPAVKDTEFGFASSDFGSGVAPEDYGIWQDYYSKVNQPVAYIYTDRPIYRPGQPVYFKGVVRIDNDLNYSLPAMKEIQVRINNSYNETVFNERLPLSDSGSFDGTFQVDNNAVLGYYYIEAMFTVDQSIGQVGFNVAEYHKPDFLITLSAGPKNVLDRQTFSIDLAASYYSGGGLVNAKVEWTLTSRGYVFNPPAEFSGFNFTSFELDKNYYLSEPYETEQVIAQGQGVTDNTGKFELTLPVDLSQVNKSRELVFEASVTDFAQTSVSASTSVIAHKSKIYLGGRPETYVGIEGVEQAFDLIALDWDGNPVPNQDIDVEIVERRWSSVQEQDPSGRIQWVSSVQEIPVTQFTGLKTDNKGKTSVQFVPPNGGIFMAKIKGRDSLGNESQSSAFMWVAGKNYIPWRQNNDRSFELVSDRALYEPGDTAEILIASPFQGDAYALVTIERGRIRSEQVLLLTTNSTIYKLPVTEDMAPNIYVSVLVVKGVDGTNPRPNFKMGFKELNVATRNQLLSLEVVPDKTRVSPGDQVNFNVVTRDFSGQPVSAEVSLSLSDLAVLSLTEPNSSPILDYFYNHRSLGVRTAVPLSLNIEDFNAFIKENLIGGSSMGSGGGKGGGEFGIISIRSNFPDTAYWNARIITDGEGKATVSVTLPDNLTTWRMDARAATFDTRVGQTTVDIVSSRPLLIRPQTPRFFVVGDQAKLAAAVHNNTDQSLSVEVSLVSQGLTLSSPSVQQVEIPAMSQALVHWDGNVDNNVDRVDLVFRAESGNLSDATRPTLGTLPDQGIPVYRYEAKETVGTSGQLTVGGSQIETILLPSDIGQPIEGTLTVRVAPSLAASMTDSLSYLEHFPYECVEQTLSRFLPNVVTTSALHTAGISDPTLEANLTAQVNTALQRLYNWQNTDGGWGWWSGMESDLLTSTYVVFGLNEASNSGYPIDPLVLDRAISFLKGNLRDFNQLTDPYLLNRQAFVLYVLAKASQPDVSRTVQLFDFRQSLAIYARAYLADTLYRIDPSDPRIKTLLSDFNNKGIVSATGTHWEEDQPDYMNWNTDTRTTAIVLSTLSEIDPGNPLNANAVRWLMSSREDTHWNGTQETAWAILALTHWMTSSNELNANYQYAIALNDQQIGSGVADSSTLRSIDEIKVDLANMLTSDANRLVVARSDGQGNLYYTAHMSISLPVEKIASLDQGIIISRSYYSASDRENPVTSANIGDLLNARITIVAPHDLHYVLVEDPLPAGLEAIDQSLLTSPQANSPKDYSWDDLWNYGWGWWHFNHIQLKDEKVVLSADYLPAGTYVYTYLVRASTPGIYKTIPSIAQEFYFPEVYGRGEGSLFTVNP